MLGIPFLHAREVYASLACVELQFQLFLDEPCCLMSMNMVCLRLHMHFRMCTQTLRMELVDLRMKNVMLHYAYVRT